MNASNVLQRRRQIARRMNELIRAREESRGLLIAFEGPDGSGKTTQRKLFKGWLLNIYQPLFWPDIVFYFAVSPETSGKRIAADRDPSYYEAGQDITDLENPLESYTQFISRVIKEYEALAIIFQFITVDAEQSI